MELGKRSAPRSGAFLAPKKTKRLTDASGAAVEVHGRISKLKFPASYELYDGYAGVVIGDRRVKGAFPLLDPNLIYHLKCRKQSSNYGVDYVVTGFLDPPFEPVKITCLTLQRMLQETLSLPPMLAADHVIEVRKLLDAWLRKDEEGIDLDWLLRTMQPTPEWLGVLSDASIVFKYERIMRLQQIWPCEALARLNITELKEVVELLPREPERFACHWKTPYNLPELTPAGYACFPRVFRVPMNRHVYCAIASYNNAKEWKKRNKQWSIPLDEMSAWPADIQYLAARQMLVKSGAYVYSRDAEGVRQRRYVTRVFIWHDLQVVRKTMASLNALFTREPKLKQRKFKIDDYAQLNSLNEGQRSVYGLLRSENFLIVLGDAGTGKTTLGHMIFKTYPRGRVLPLAFFGKVAANLREKYGVGMTIHKLITETQQKLKSVEALAKKTRVVIIDEGSTLTVDLLHSVFECLPKLRKLIIMGDEKQTPPPTSGAVFYALIEHYAGTPVVQRLSVIERQNSAILKENFYKIHTGSHELDYSTDLASEHPFVLLERESFPDIWDHERKHAVQRVSAYRRMLAPVAAHYGGDESRFQIITQTNRVIEDLNHAMFLLGQDSQSTYGTSTFYVGDKVQIRQNDYGSNAAKAKLPAHVSSDAVFKGEVYTIAEIYDALPHGDPEEKHSRRSTAEAKSVSHAVRMIRFAGAENVKLNLKHYPIANLKKGSASTIHSNIGSETAEVVGVVHERFSHTWTREDLYTLVTRAAKRVVIICGGVSGDLRDCDLAKIIANPTQQRECVFSHWLKPYASAAAVEHEEQ